MDTKEVDYIPEPASEIGVGCWVTWGWKWSCHRVVDANKDILTIETPGFHIKSGEPTSKATPKKRCISWNEENLELVYRPGDGPGEEVVAPQSPPAPTSEDVVVKPAHYTRFALEPVTFIMKNDLPFHVGNIVKYACRAGHKIYAGKSQVESEITDLKKVQRYAAMRINQLEGKEVL